MRHIKLSYARGGLFALPNRKKKSKFSMEEFIRAVDAGDRETVVRLLAALKKKEKTTIVSQTAGETPIIILMLTIAMQHGHESMQKHRILMLVFTVGCCRYPHVLAEVKEKDHIFSTIVPQTKFKAVYKDSKSHPLRGVYDKMDKLMNSKKDLTSLEKNNTLLEMVTPLASAGWGQDIKENHKFFRRFSKATGQLEWMDFYYKVVNNACFGETAYREKYVQNVINKLQEILAINVPKDLLDIIVEYCKDLTDKPQHESIAKSGCIIA